MRNTFPRVQQDLQSQTTISIRLSTSPSPEDSRRGISRPLPETNASALITADNLTHPQEGGSHRGESRGPEDIRTHQGSAGEEERRRLATNRIPVSTQVRITRTINCRGRCQERQPTSSPILFSTCF